MHFLNGLFLICMDTTGIPLTWISHALDYTVWGLNPLGHHLTNILFHAVNTFVVVLLMIRLLNTRKEPAMNEEAPGFLTAPTILIAAGITGILFGLHPLHVESVAWVAERKDVLCALFFLLSLMQYTTYVRTVANAAALRGPFARFFNGTYLFTLGFFILALLSKPMDGHPPCCVLDSRLVSLPKNTVLSGISASSG